jgi:hypothetical protein
LRTRSGSTRELSTALSTWTVIEHAESFWVQDASGQTVGWFCFRHNEETARHAKVPPETRLGRVAVNFARLPLLRIEACLSAGLWMGALGSR